MPLSTIIKMPNGFYTKQEGQPQLWYLPKFGFRLVVRNLPRKRILSDIKHRVFLRETIPPCSGSSVKTYKDSFLFDQEDFFVFPRNDHVLVSFRLAVDGNGNLNFVLTDKLGQEKKVIPLVEFNLLICDYAATVENVLNFDVKLAKRVEVKATTLHSAWEEIQRQDVEQRFPVDRIRDVG